MTQRNNAAVRLAGQRETKVAVEGAWTAICVDLVIPHPDGAGEVIEWEP
jgi:hypothetical protein